MFQMLIVDDNAPFRQSLKQMLCEQFSGMGIEEAGTRFSVATDFHDILSLSDLMQ